MNNYYCLIGADFAPSKPSFTSFEKSRAYDAGDVVLYWGKFWQATRKVDPPFFSWFPWSGEIPGDSSAWRSVGASSLGADASSSPDDLPAPSSVMLPIRRGMSGAAVRYVQQKVGVPVDGKFGPGTETAVKNYQGSHGLAADGIVGNATLAAMKADSSPSIDKQAAAIADAQATVAKAAVEKAAAAQSPAQVKDAGAAVVVAASKIQAETALSPDQAKALANARIMAQEAHTPAEVQAAAAQVEQVSKQLSGGRDKPSWLPHGALALGIIGGISIFGLGATIYLASKAKWGWALVNFFAITPAAVAAAGFGVAAAQQKRLV